MFNMTKDPYYYETLGQNFENFMSDYDVAQRLVLIKHFLKSKRYGSILEVGCGTGRISRCLKAVTDDLTVNDISVKLSQTVAQDLGCRFLAGDCAHLNPDKKYDLVVSSECIEHTPDPYASLRQMSALLKEKGDLIITTPNRLWYPVLAVASALRLRKFDGIENWTWPSKTQRWLRTHHFKEIYFSGCHLFPWQLPLAKKILPPFDRYGPLLYPVMINYGFSARKMI